MHYQLAITRKPGHSFSQGLTTAKRGAPDFDLALAQHAQYVATLKACGLAVIDLDADENFPDGCFVEDAALITPAFAVITNPGTASRQGETAALIPVLEKYRTLKFLDAAVTLDGGDVLLIGKTFYVGISARTTRQAAAALRHIVQPHGYEVVPIVVNDILHLKTGVCYIGNDTIVVTRQFADCPEFRRYQKIETLPAEDYAANCLRLNDHLVMAAGFPNLPRKLLRLDLPILAVDMSESRKMDGGLTCSSLLLQ